MKKLLVALPLALLCSSSLSAQQTGYLDDYTMRIRPEKYADFDTVSKKIAEANRKAKGETWLALQSVYGPDYTVVMVATQENYAAVENGAKAFMAAITEAYGPGGMKKMMADSTPTVVSAAGRLRVRRADLSANSPKDQNAYSQLVGNMRYLRMTEYRVKNGHIPQFEKLAMQAKEAYEKNSPNSTYYMSQSVAGAPGGTFYVSVLVPNMAAFDNPPNLKKMMGEEEFAKWSAEGAECVESSENFIYRVNPEWSNPPKEIADVAPDFWHPKVMTMAKPKPKSAEGAKAGTN